MRLFLAIHLSDPAIDHLRKVQSQLRSVAPDLAYTRDVNLHLTVRFLGEMREDQLDNLKDAVRRTCESGGALPLAASRLVGFPLQKPANVIAAQIAGAGAEQLSLLQSAIERAIRSFGVAAETHKYTPHVTLARPKNTVPLPVVQQLIRAAERSWPGPTFEARRIHLMESELGPAGPKYRTVADFDLFG